MAARKKQQTEISYTDASNELETILGEIEDGSVDVDVLTDKVERAAELIKVCRDKLSGTEMRVTKVVEELAELAKSKSPAPEGAADVDDRDGEGGDDEDAGEAEAGDGLPF